MPGPSTAGAALIDVASVEDLSGATASSDREDRIAAGTSVPAAIASAIWTVDRHREDQ